MNRSSRDDRRRERAIAWGLVAVQAALIVAILLVPVGDAWPLPSLAAALATALTGIGGVLIVWAVLVFGRGVTPSPLPSGKASLTVRGPYRWMRHPMYTGVITMMAGAAMSRRSWLALALWVTLVAFFHTKAGWEERRLVATYQGYREYRDRTARFVPFLQRAQG